jgi:outer membrane receptor protein involved in Fe transport
MNRNLQNRRAGHAQCRMTPQNARLYRAAILLVSFTWGGTVLAQTTNAPLAAASAATGSDTNVVKKLTPVDVFGRLEAAQSQILPDLGATVYPITKDQIANIAGGENAPMNDVLLRAPGIAQDSAANGDLHLRGEHANIQYRINDVLLPEGITGFGQELDTRFVDSLRLITGSLPAQYGFRTAGVVDIRTKSGVFEPGGAVSVYGGSYDTIKPSFEIGGSEGKLSYYADGSYTHNALGIENPTSASTAIHDVTDQYKAFTYFSYLLDDTSRLTAMGSVSYADFQVPNQPGLPPGTSPSGTNWSQFMSVTNFDSAQLDENQNEQNYYAVLAYQKSVGDFNLQVAGYGRASSVHFTPDPVGDLFFNGVASDVDRKLYSGGFQADASYNLAENNTVRGGLMLLDESLSADTATTVFPVNATGDPTGTAFPIIDNSVAHALFFGLYLQDEWKFLPRFTLNFGARMDWYYASFDNENQPSPRVNLTYQPTDSTTLHAGYARYFTPPPLENVPSTTVQKFDNTSNASAVTQNDPVKAERANYFDLGISQKVARGLQVGLDGYYKTAQNQLDDGLFGQTLILSAFNYRLGDIYGAEFTTSYTLDGFTAYANVAYSHAQGEDINSAQFLFDPAKLAYTVDHWIYLDHDQTVTGSFGASYLWTRPDGGTRFFVDALYGSGLRADETLSDGTVVPNGGTVPSYYSVGMGVEERIKIRGKEHLRARLDVVNVTDNVYQLRNGTGIGVNAPQYGMRLGFFGTLSLVF